jgi:hypothetical protein
MALTTSLASVEYTPDRGGASFRGVPADQVEQFSTAAIRLFVPDVPGMDAGTISASGISRLRARLQHLSQDVAHAGDDLDWPANTAATQYLLWNGDSPARLTRVQRAVPLGDLEAFRNFLAHGAGTDELLIAVADTASHQAFVDLVRALAAHLFAFGWDNGVVAEPALFQTTPEEAARDRSLILRDELLARHWPTSAQVAKLLGSQATNAAQYAAKKRTEGKLFGVWSLKDNTYVHPDFQFDGYHQLHPAMPALLAALASIPGMSDADDPGGWRRAFWLYGETSLLSERALGAGKSEVPRSAADVFRVQPDAVIALADKEAARNPNAEW